METDARSENQKAIISAQAEQAVQDYDAMMLAPRMVTTESCKRADSINQKPSIVVRSGSRNSHVPRSQAMTAQS